MIGVSVSALISNTFEMCGGSTEHHSQFPQTFVQAAYICANTQRSRERAGRGKAGAGPRSGRNDDRLTRPRRALRHVRSRVERFGENPKRRVARIVTTGHGTNRPSAASL